MNERERAEGEQKSAFSDFARKSLIFDPYKELSPFSSPSGLATNFLPAFAVGIMITRVLTKNKRKHTNYSAKI